MVDIMAIQGAIASLKTAGEIAKGLHQLKSQADIQIKVIELQEMILSAQQSALTAQSDHLAMIQRVRDLEEEIAQVKAWEETKQRYQLITPWPGFHVYALKESSKGTEPPHWICAHCYEDGRKSLLNNLYIREGRRNILKCSHCKFEIDTLVRAAEIERRYV